MTVRAAGDPRAIPKTLKLYAFAGFMVIALIMPFVLDGYTTYRLAMALAMAMAILGVNLLTGLSGQFSIGHGAFFAIGAYTTAISMNHLGLSAYTAIPLAAVISFIAGFLFGWPALRLNLIHLMLMTWGLSLVLPQILKLEEFQDWTGGVSGVYLDRPDPPDWTHLTDDQYWYFVALIILVIFFWLAGNLGNSRSGRALAAIRDNQIAAAPMGINVALFKTQIFGVSAMYAGIGGAVTGLLTDFVAPDSYGLFFSITLLVGAVMAGFRSVWGALLGALIVLFLPGATGALPASLAVPPFGFMVLAIIFFMPDGISGLALRTYRRYANGKKGR